jgi:hypothetical protein
LVAIYDTAAAAALQKIVFAASAFDRLIAAI